MACACVTELCTRDHGQHGWAPTSAAWVIGSMRTAADMSIWHSPLARRSRHLHPPRVSPQRHPGRMEHRPQAHRKQWPGWLRPGWSITVSASEHAFSGASTGALQGIGYRYECGTGNVCRSSPARTLTTQPQATRHSELRQPSDSGMQTGSGFAAAASRDYISGSSCHRLHRDTPTWERESGRLNPACIQAGLS